MIIETVVLSLSIASTCARRGPGEYLLDLHATSSNVCTVGGSHEPSLLHSKSLEEALAADLSVIPEISMVCVERADDTLLVWISVDNPSSEVRERIFQKQYDLIEGIPEIYFDFNLIASKGRSANDFASGAKLIYSREG